MKQPIRYLLSLLLFYLLVFALGKAGFMIYNHESASFTTLDFFAVWWNGLTQDLAMAAYLLFVPWLACMVGIWCPRFHLRYVLALYFVAVGLALTVITAADLILYEHWQFKLDSSIYNYLNTQNGAAESVTTGFLIGCAVALVSLTTLFSVPAIALTPKHFTHKQGVGRATSAERRGYASCGMLLIAFLMGLITFGAREDGRLSVGSAYYSPTLFFNHAAVNPSYSLLASTLQMKPYGEQFRYLSDEEAQATFQGLYPGQSEDSAEESLLRSQRPIIVGIQLESFGAQFIQELGGLPDVCPNLSRYIPEGILFDQCYANSFRTDRGTVSVLSGHISYPTVSLMKEPPLYEGIASLAHSLQAEGYQPHYFYGGDANFMGKIQYLHSVGFQRVTSEPDLHLAPEERSSWGASDERIFHEAYQALMTDTMPSFTVVQTLDSHEPFEVPYDRLQDKVQNAFAYTDHCLGQFLDSLKASPLWDNMLIVIYADHGIMYRQNYQDPEFFHIPLIWLGGALREPRRISTLINQSDIAATLLGQLGISHSQYPWSRDVLSANYRYPFAYCTFPSGIMWRDQSGCTIFDTNAQRTIYSVPQKGTDQRLKHAKAVLQKSYDNLPIR